MIIHAVSTSGGADSAATLLLALERFGGLPGRVVPVFADTGNEHEITLDYLDYLQDFIGIPIVRLRADFSAEIAAKRRFIARDRRTARDDKGRRQRWSNAAKRRALEVLHPTGNPFLDLCLWKGRFPSRKAQFCTEKLKRDTIVSHQLDWLDQGHTVISWQGVRRDESANRRDALRFEKLGPRFYAFRPLVDWTKGEVFDYCASKGLRPNPLYLQGMARVGCMPCINCGKEELRQIAARFPAHIDRIAEWEELVSRASKRGRSTFFHHLDGGDMSGARPDWVFRRCNVRQSVEWSRTSRGGRHFDYFAQPGAVDVSACESRYAKLCE